MAIYSHSKLSTFEQCKQKYKFRYIEKIKPDFEASIESHLGKAVHDTLEWLYKSVLNNNLPTLDQIIEFYIEKWQNTYKKNCKIVKVGLTEKDYFNKGVKFLIDYYVKHQPFNKDNTLEMEKRVYVELEKNFPHKIIGYIDRLVHNKETNTYEIHDYKTANFLPNQAKFDQDRQLALYGIAIKQLYGQDKNLLLVWHYLNHNKKIISKRTDEQLNQLKHDIINLIKQIESTKDFPLNKSPLCGWCEYKSSCPGWK